MDRILRGYFHDRDSLEPVSQKELLDRTREGIVTVLDVRPRVEFDEGHIPGAVNIPLKELENRLSSLDKGKEVVAYCRGPYCVLSFEAVASLRKNGFKARRFLDGFPEWKANGGNVELTQ